MKKTSIGLIVLLVLMSPLFWYIFKDRSQPNLEYMFNMRHTPAFKSFSPNLFLKGGMTLQAPVAGTIPRGFAPFDASHEDAKSIKNPYEASAENLERGKHIFNTFCIICHGATGHSDGSIVPPFPPPPMLIADNARKLSDGEMMWIISNGRGLMPSYASQIEVSDRWKAIQYVRQMQQEEPLP